MEVKPTKVIISCSTKFWAFPLAEQLEKHDCLSMLITTYSSQKNTIAKHFIKRRDKENITTLKIKTCIPLAIGMKLFPNPFFWNDLFDRWVAYKIKRSDAEVFIGWSGMSLRSIRAAKKKGMITVLERGSAHISYQLNLLSDEFNKNGLPFKKDERIKEKELIEYQEADYIAIPSSFVKNTFVDKGIPEHRLVINPYGASSLFKFTATQAESGKFIVVYLGALMVRKGITYLLEAIKKLDITETDFEVWFIGAVMEDVKKEVENVGVSQNIKFFGHVSQHQLPELLSSCSVGVVPSIEDGFGMVVPQLLACKVPVIVTENTGAADLITNGKNGYVIPIRDSLAIKEKIELLYNDKELLARMKENAPKLGDLSWDAYGDRYVATLEKISIN